MSLYELLKEGYQKRVVDNNVLLIKDVLQENKKGLGRQTVVAPTGSGKTFMMAATIEVGLKVNEVESSFIWLTHNRQLLSQTENEISEALEAYLTPVSNIEHGIEGYGGRVLLFNVQKGVSDKAKSWLKKWYKYQREVNRKVIFIVDEADEGMSGVNMNNLRKILHPSLEIGFTASFKKKENEYEFQRVEYKEVIEAGMLVQNIYWQASDEVTQIEMMRRAIAQRDSLEKQALALRFVKRYFVPKMIVQTQASLCEEVARTLGMELGLTEEEFNKQVIVHVQNSRGLDDVSDMGEVRYIVGDMMLERGWNCPEAYVLLSMKDSVSPAKGVQLLGRVIRLPGCEPFDETLDAFNAGYVYISGKHSIEKSAANFGETSIALPPPKEVIQVEKSNIKVPSILTFKNQLEKDIEDPEYYPITEKFCDILLKIKNDCLGKKPEISHGELDIKESNYSISPVEEVETDWNTLQVKKILIDALSKYLPRDYANLVVVKFQTSLSKKGGLSSISQYSKQIAKEIKERSLIKKLAEKLKFKHERYEWPEHKLISKKPNPLKCKRALYPLVQVNGEEKKFAQFLDGFCVEHDCYWVRNDVSDIKLFKGHSPDFIVFNEEKYVFVEFKGKHLLRTPDSIIKNNVGQMASQYFMVYLDSDVGSFMLKNYEGTNDEVFTADHLITAL